MQPRSSKVWSVFFFPQIYFKYTKLIKAFLFHGGEETLLIVLL